LYCYFRLLDLRFTYNKANIVGNGHFRISIEDLFKYADALTIEFAPN
jgi:hypothetical protein